ncbi:MAG: hypothetical protein ACT4QC_20975 [Planctomycetaceae bacterium]
MLESGIELAVGESVRLADHVLTILDIHGDEITIRVDRFDDDPLGESFAVGNLAAYLPPR